MSKIPRAGEKRRHNEGGPRHWKNAMGLLNSVFKIPLLQTSNTYLKCALRQNPFWSWIRINLYTNISTYHKVTNNRLCYYSIFDHSGGYSTGKLGQTAGDTNWEVLLTKMCYCSKLYCIYWRYFCFSHQIQSNNNFCRQTSFHTWITWLGKRYRLFSIATNYCH